MTNNKLPDVGTTIFTVMSRLANQSRALNLSQGFPDFSPPPELLDRVTHHLHAGNNQYAEMAGIEELRRAVADKIREDYGRQVDPMSEVTITSGATEALYAAITAFVTTGDEVLLLDPAYDSYAPAVSLAGGHSIHIPLVAPTYHVDWDRVADAVSDRTRMIVINTPHNPTGAVMNETDIDALAAIVSNRSILVLSDEVYEHIVFDNETHQSLNRYEELANRSIVVSSFGKTYHMTGWKIGYCIAPQALTAEFRKVHQFVQFCVAAPLQYALADFVSQSTHHRELGEFYAAKRDRFCDLLSSSRFRLRPSAGTYFQLADYSEISDAPDTEFTRTMTVEHGVAAIPTSVFYASPPADHRVVRFCFAKTDETLDRAAEKLCAI